MIAEKLARLTRIERQIELATALEKWQPQLTEYAYTWSLGWPAELGLGIDVRYRALAICEVDECKQIGLRVDEPRLPWSWDSVLDGLVDVGRLPLNGVVYAIDQVKDWWPHPEDAQLLVRYHDPIRRR